MKRTLVAILALSPALAFAQTNTPAQPRSTQISEVVVPADFHAAASAADHSATPATVRVSTGVTAPHVTQTVAFVSVAGPKAHKVAVDEHVVVTLDVDANGTPANLAVVKSANPALDQDVVATVSKYHFTPGKLDGQPTSVPVRLEVIVPAGTSY
jgi:TonB family protein